MPLPCSSAARWGNCNIPCLTWHALQIGSPTLEREEHVVDIHKPKPVHSWREFASEILVIVIGIAIALTGEQIIVMIHERQVAIEARDQVQTEIALDLAVLGNRVRTEPCITRRIRELRSTIATSDTSAYVAPNHVGRTTMWVNQSGRWQAASQGGRVALLGSKEQGGYSFIYSELAQVMSVEADEAQQWSRLQALEGVAHPSPTLVDSARAALSQAAYDDEMIKIYITQSSGAANKMHISPVVSPVIQKHSSLCDPINEPIEQDSKSD